MRNEVPGNLWALGSNAIWQHFQPVFVLSAPRAGSTLLFELLVRYLDCFSIGDESHSIYAQFPSLRKENKEYDSGSLGAEHATPDICHNLRLSYAKAMRNSKGQAPEWDTLAARSSQAVFLEKTPRNALNIPFLLSVFPNARFIYLYRNGQQNIASLTEAWEFGQRTGHFVTYPNLPGFVDRHWCFLLPPGWRQVKSSEFTDIAAFQWLQTNRIIQSELAKLQNSRWCTISYEELIETPTIQLQKLARFSNLPLSASAYKLQASSLPHSATTLSKPDAYKWKRYSSEMTKHSEAITQMMNSIGDFSKEPAKREIP